jgi:hypothetical protein
MASKEAKRLYDFVDGIQGTYVNTVKDGVQADDPNLDNPCKIEYIPDQPVFKAMRRAVKMLFGVNTTVMTNRVYPEEAIKHKTLSSDEEGVPNRAVFILEDEHENQPLLEAVKMDFSESVAKMSKKKSESEKKQMHSDIQGLEEEDKDKRDSSEPNKPRGGRRRGGGDDKGIRDMF